MTRPASVTAPEQDQIDHWLDSAKYQIDRKWQLFQSGFYEREALPLQGMYTTLATLHASLGRAKCLNGDPIEEVRACLTEAARHILKSFRMAYDPADPEYQGEAADFIEVDENTFFSGAYWALMAGDFALAAELAHWFQRLPEEHAESPELNGYAHALALWLRGEQGQARERVGSLVEFYRRKPIRGNGWRVNYYSQFLPFQGIVEGEATYFNKGLEGYLYFYDRHIARKEEEDGDEGFICDVAVALANLGLREGLPVTVEHYLLPKRLLLESR